MITVKIIKSPLPTLWYNNYIGCIFEVNDDGDDYWEIKDLRASNLRHLVRHDEVGLIITKDHAIIVNRREKLDKIISKINGNR